MKITTQFQANFSGNDFRNHTFNTEKENKYEQVFNEKHNFIPHLSILDLLFNLGPETEEYLLNLDLNIPTKN